MYEIVRLIVCTYRRTCMRLCACVCLCVGSCVCTMQMYMQVKSNLAIIIWCHFTELFFPSLNGLDRNWWAKSQMTCTKMAFIPIDAMLLINYLYKNHAAHGVKWLELKRKCGKSQVDTSGHNSSLSLSLYLQNKQRISFWHGIKTSFHFFLPWHIIIWLVWLS